MSRGSLKDFHCTEKGGGTTRGGGTTSNKGSGRVHTNQAYSRIMKMQYEK